MSRNCQVTSDNWASHPGGETPGAAACRHSLQAEPWPGELGLHSPSRWFTIRALRSVYVFGTPLLDDYVSPLEVVGCYF